MEWSPKQDRALREVSAWLDSPTSPQVFRLFGYAGTGKTTLAKHLAEGVDGTVLFAAFTGKAASVLRAKGCTDANTIHSLIYHSSNKSASTLEELKAALETKAAEFMKAGRDPYVQPAVQRLAEQIRQETESLRRPSFRLNWDSKVRDASLVIIDECSMVDADMGQDLLSFGTKVLVLGDPAQLPPIGGAGFFTENVEPDIMLDEIHRQAVDNPIIGMATRVREGRTLDFGSYGNSAVVHKNELTAVIATGADQILVGKNDTRRGYNRRLRQLYGIEGDLPVQGDRLVCLRNDKETGLLNGAIYHTVVAHPPEGMRMMLGIVPESEGEAKTEPSLEVECHTHHFMGVGQDLPYYERKEAQEFDYGYALTCHKAQGSQWDEVLIVDESYCFRKDATRWLYTAITRAAEKVIVAR